MRSVWSNDDPLHGDTISDLSSETLEMRPTSAHQMLATTSERRDLHSENATLQHINGGSGVEIRFANSTWKIGSNKHKIELEVMIYKPLGFD
jgi:hypothetical protein